MTRPVPVLEPRSAEALAAALYARIGGYLPGWQPAPGGPGDGLLAISGTLLRTLAERLNAAPEKNRLAFLDLLGLELLAAQAARAPVVFTVAAGAAGAVPAGTRLGATRPGGGDPIAFATEARVIVSPARLAEVASLWPGRDEWADHSADATGGRAFTAFTGLVRVPHELYLSSERQLSLAGRSAVDLEVRLGTPGSEPLVIAWEYWDGTAWRVLDVDDGTLGLTRSGTVRLTADCATSVARRIDGIGGHWLRGRLGAPLPPIEGRVLATVDTLRVRSEIDQTLPGAGCAGGLLPDAAYADGQRLDLTKTFRPLGAQPEPGATLVFSLAAAFDRPGTHVTVCLDRATTAAEQADADTDKFTDQVNAAADQLSKALDAAKHVVALLAALPLGVDPIPDFDNWAALNAWRDKVEQEVKAALVALAAAVAQTRLFTDSEWVADVLFNPLPIFDSAKSQFPAAAREIAKAIAQLVKEDDLAQMLAVAASPLNGDAFVGAFRALQLQLQGKPSPPSFLEGLPLQNLDKPVRDEYTAIAKRITDARADVTTALTAAKDVVHLLETLDPAAIAVHNGAPRPEPPKPQLKWEYFDGAAWRDLPLLAGTVNMPDHGKTGRVSFDVPEDWEPTEVDGRSARWVRVRLAGGVFGRLDIVTWRDGETQQIKQIPIIEPRPPEVNAMTVGYRYEPPAEPLDRCLVRHDFEWADRSTAARWPGDEFTPFAPVADRTAALYLGFDAPLPAGTVGLYLDVEERPAGDAPALEWEYHDGDWRPLEADDGTRALAESGLVLVQWPGVPAPDPVLVASAAGREVVLVDARDAARFVPGERLFLSADGQGELVTVAARTPAGLTLDGTLGADYGQAALAPPALPRFGTPRTWIRALLRADAAPPQVTVRHVTNNAAPAVQVQTVTDEVLGPLTASPDQGVFTNRAPVLRGQAIELRERTGARADVEQGLVRKDVVASGGAASDVRTVPDPRTGHVREVWVRWYERPTLLFSGPNERHYTIERSRGRIAFGDGVHGRVPPPDADGLRVSYQTTEGAAGNVAAGAIATLLGATAASAVTNPRAAEGGADGEREPAVPARGAEVLRHRRQAVSLGDYEGLAHEASPAVALARATPARRPGAVSLVIAPRSPEAEPQPSPELRRRVEAFVAARMPTARLTVIGPRYLAVGVAVEIAPAPGVASDAVVRAVRDALAAALHPFAADRPFGRDVHAADVAAVVGAVDGVEQTRALALVVDGFPVGDTVVVPADRVASAGPLEVTLAAGAV